MFSQKVLLLAIDAHFDDFVKSRKTPSPSMGEGWGEGG
jgi:hypothetical protein